MAFIARTIQELGLTQDLLRQGLDNLTRPRTVMRNGQSDRIGPAVVIEEGRVALRETHAAELSLARSIRRLAGAEHEALEVPADLWDGFEPHEAQVDALAKIAQARVSILTGGPGVGKTTIVRTTLKLFQDNGLKVIQVAPTGKAAIRMTDQTGFPARTIHRALGFSGQGWIHHSGNPMPVSAVIADESSMVDVHLFASLLAAAKTGTRVLLVGDIDQLPSIQAGRVLYDLIQSGVIAVARLTKIFRQASESRIPYVARDINEGRVPDNLVGEGTDVRFVERGTEEAVLDLIVKAVTIGIPQQKGIPTRDIQVLAAQKSRSIGVEALNIALQSAVNPTQDHQLDISVGANYQVRPRDRIIHTKNNYDLGVMNGEMGWIIETHPLGVDLDKYPDVHTSEDVADDAAEDLDVTGYDDGDDDDFGHEGSGSASMDPDSEESKVKKRKKIYVLVAEFDGRQVAYNKAEARELQLGYAITVHKSQGSQFKAVVMVAHSAHQFMLTRQLLYTGITRAEKYVLIVGQEAAVAKAARNVRGAERRTQLQRFLTSAA